MWLQVKLGLLVAKRRRRPPKALGSELATAVSLWPAIVARTDEIYVAYEKYEKQTRKAIELAVKAAGLNPADLLHWGDFKDPVRLHEKAVDDYFDFFRFLK